MVNKILRGRMPMDTIQPGFSSFPTGRRVSLKSKDEGGFPPAADAHPFDSIQDRLQRESDAIAEKARSLTADIELHDKKYNSLNKTLNRMLFGLFMPSTLAAMLIPGGQTIGMSVFLTTAAVMGGLAYLRSREEKEIRADYTELREEMQKKKAIDVQSGQAKDVKDMADSLNSDGDKGKVVDDYDDLFVEIDGIKLEKRQQLISDIREIMKHSSES
jgi:hypothetical protein